VDAECYEKKPFLLEKTPDPLLCPKCTLTLFFLSRHGPMVDETSGTDKNNPECPGSLPLML
jgi:hypothetical protein